MKNILDGEKRKNGFVRFVLILLVLGGDWQIPAKANAQAEKGQEIEAALLQEQKSTIEQIFKIDASKSYVAYKAQEPIYARSSAN